MSDKPEKIFLRKLTHFDMLCSVWGKKRVRDTDIEYIRADLAKPSEWISVGDRLPEAGEYVLAYFTNALVSHLNWGLHPQIITRQLVTEKGDRWADEGVTHWQPLPSPPDKE